VSTVPPSPQRIKTYRYTYPATEYHALLEDPRIENPTGHPRGKATDGVIARLSGAG